MKKKLRIKNDICDRCGLCIGVCPTDALSFEEHIHIDYARCIVCLKCERMCPFGAIVAEKRNDTK